MHSDTLKNKSVRELQAIAQRAPIRRRERRRSAPSRAARLQLIDILSRRSIFGLALLGGSSIYMAIVAGRLFPSRAAAWTAMAFAALYVCRRLQSQYRSGNAITSRPFRWRASFTACLSVLGVIFGAAPILLTPTTAPTALALQIAAVTYICGVGASFLFIAHMPTALSVFMPVAIFAALVAMRAGELTVAAGVGVTGAFLFSAVYIANSSAVAAACKQRPRTAWQRREAIKPRTAAVSTSSFSSSALR